MKRGRVGGESLRLEASVFSLIFHPADRLGNPVVIDTYGNVGSFTGDTTPLTSSQHEELTEQGAGRATRRQSYLMLEQHAAANPAGNIPHHGQARRRNAAVELVP